MLDHLSNIDDNLIRNACQAVFLNINLPFWGPCGMPKRLPSVDNLLKTVDKPHKLGKSRPYVRKITNPLPPYVGGLSHLPPYRENPHGGLKYCIFCATLPTNVLWIESR